MGVFDKLKDSVSFISNESLGEIDPKVVKEERKDSKPKKETKPKKEKSTKVTKEPKVKKEKTNFLDITSKFNKVVENSDVPVIKKSKNVSSNSHRHNYQILNVLGIDYSYNVDDLVDLNEFEDVEFTRVAPVGIDIPEVERYVEKSVRAISKLLQTLERRQHDFERLAMEASNLEAKLIAKQHDTELTNSVLATKEKEDRLKERVVELQLENQELKHKLEQRLHPLSDLPIIEKSEFNNSSKKGLPSL